MKGAKSGLSYFNFLFETFLSRCKSQPLHIWKATSVWGPYRGIRFQSHFYFIFTELVFFCSNLAIFVFDPLFFVNFVNFCVQILGNKYAKCSLNTILVVYWNGSVLEFIIRIPMLLWTIQNWVVSKPGPCSKGYKGYL